MTDVSEISAEPRAQQRWLWALCAALIGAGAAIDTVLPLGVAAGIVYLAAVLAAMWLPRRTAPLLFAGVGTLLVLGGYYWSPEGGPSLAALTNRGLAVAALWATALALYSRERVMGAYQEVAEDLRKAQRIARFGDFELNVRTGQFRWADEVFRIMGRDRQEGAPMLAEYLDEIVHPDDRAQVSRLARRAMQDGQAFDHDYRIVQPDGSVRHVHSIGAPERGADGDVARIIGTYLDITDRKMTEEALAERERRLRSVVETAPEGVITIDETGTIESFSAAAEQLFGYAANEVIGRNVAMLMPSPHREWHDEYLARYLRTGERRIIGIGRLVEGLRKDGSVFPMELAVGEIELSGQRIFTGFVRDITERRKMEQELQQAQKMEAVGQLTAGIAHDFNNLLTSITGNLEMLDGRITDPDQRTLLEEAEEAAELGAELTGRLLAFGRRQPLEPQRVNLAEIVAGMRGMLHRTLGEAIKVRTKLADRVPDCIIDPGQMESVILNLAINARDAMPEGGELTVEVSEAELDADYAAQHPEVRQGRHVLLAVTDTGVGMTAQVRDKVFEPFFTTKESGAGTGLGLSTAYGFVKQSGGHIRLYSEPGHGTTVAIYLPPAEAAPMTDGTPEAAPVNGYEGRGETVLLVEDDDRVRRVSAARLRELGYHVVEAADGSQAVDLLADGVQVELVFTDMVMPGGVTGSEVAERARERNPDIKVLFTSGYAEPEVVHRSAHARAAWLRKPYSKQTLARKLRELLDGEPKGAVR